LTADDIFPRYTGKGKVRKLSVAAMLKKKMSSKYNG